ncbi:AFR133Cp [Eremothecium gossypii ATCC 10895]|uniref:AFR133Cp n=1 Tax=Eremothecium gossypii (strain ATCC 10895 / CBS 109.51 / FGSC 9923 / NRRL Y-1056) TaxID=284811 RepID=Q754D7_EREGS|nr:AFR133Cp [Eremothecium gossypii ATCC 10895]AAS53504.1 AFR133Cp [Eremothecium gossypii ATCC 10895]AEY97816.1 FAFR133Cp [Eremothecium gossypii FDAG1]
MGVHALWDILGPTARPVKLESLSNNRMAVDASIWIYQFLKAARDKNGNRLKGAHIIGFFRRICKLLYFGIKPVFVFDGGVPPLKRETIRQRKERREGKRESAAVTARKLLALQVQQQGDTAFKGNSRSKSEGSVTFRPSDEYELPNIPGFLYDERDERVMSTEEYKAVFEHLDELDGIDLESINPASKEFDELPNATQYLILSTLRLRSRLRMGYTKEQLEEIFKDSMDFSRFQIEMVKKRNFYTQKLMNTTGVHDGGLSKLDLEHSRSRVAGQRQKEYTLVKTEMGWAMSLGEYDGSEASKAIPLDDAAIAPTRPVQSSWSGNDVEDSDEDNLEWEDIDIAPKKEKKVADYSLKASAIPTTIVEGSSTGSQSFLDRPFRNSGKLRQPERAIQFVDDNSTDSDREYLDYVEETTNMEELKKTRGNLAGVEHRVSKHNPYKTAPDNATSEESLKDLSEVEEVPRKPGTRNDAQFPLQHKGTHNIMTDKINSELNDRMIPDVHTLPSINLGKGSFLFDIKTSKEESSSSGETKPEQRKINQDVPLWFNSVPTTNPHTATGFVSDKETSTFTEDEKLGIFSGVAATELMRQNVSSTDLESLEKELDGDSNDLEELTQLNKEHTEPTRAPDIPKGYLLKDTTQRSKEESTFAYDFPEEEEEVLVEQLRKEHADYNRFKHTLDPSIATTAFIEDELYEQNTKDKRDADEVTPEMIRDIQQLLSIFGIPYLTAPMEAEAQCAELLRLKLIDGIITDDSDVFLFGGSKVFKNMFQEKNYVEYYNTETISAELGLDRLKFIALAQLMGSDYTNGIKGIGPVSGIEILANYNTLEEFRTWYNEGQFRKSLLDKESLFQKNLRKKLTKSGVVLGDDFPSAAVSDAYLNPEVDHDTTKFVWGLPELDSLRTFLGSTLGWPTEKADEVLIPLIRELNKRRSKGTQSTLVEFFPTKFIDADKGAKLGRRIRDATVMLKKRRTK